MICSVERTGSTWLSSLLQSTGIAGNPRYEYFSDVVEAMTAEEEGITSFRDYLQHVVTDGATDNGVLGINVMWRHLPMALRKIRNALDLYDLPDCEVLRRVLPGLDRFLFTHRSDHLDQAISWARAYQSAQWRSTDEPQTSEPKYDFNLIDILHQNAIADDYAWRTWFARFDIRPLPIGYEQLTADPGGVVNDVLAYLGLHPASGRQAESALRKQGDELNLEWKQRYLRDLQGWRTPPYEAAVARH